MITPEYLAIGHITRDLLPSGGSTAGGTALYAGTTAYRLGVSTGIFTAAAELPASLPEALLVARTPTEVTSTFENRYLPDGRQQWLHAAADPVRLADLPVSWRQVPLVHLGPVLHECSLE